MNQLTTIDHSVLAFIRRHDSDLRGIAAAIGEQLEAVSASLVSLDDSELIDFSRGTWRLTPAGMNALAGRTMEAAQ